MRDTTWLQRWAEALYAGAVRLVLGLTDWIIDSALSRLGEPMEWEDVERLAQGKIEEEHRMAAERWRALQERGKPVLRLLSKS